MVEKSQYNSYLEWKKVSPKDFYFAYSNGKLDEICEIFGWTKMKKNVTNKYGYWTKEKCIIDALKYSSRSEWQINSVSAYNRAYRKKWIEECCKHMSQKQKPNRFWEDKDNCFFHAKKCKGRGEFRVKYSGAYQSSSRNGWLDEFSKILWPLKHSRIIEWNNKHNKI